MTAKSLQDVMDQVGNFADYLRNYPSGAYTFPVVPTEFSNWRSEQYAWNHSAVLLDQSHHMTYLYLRGKDAVQALKQVSVNSFEGFRPDKAKQIICCAPSGHLIGDGILFFLGEEHLLYVGRPIVANWIRYHAGQAGLDVEFTQEARSPSQAMGRPVTRSLYRYQIQGPHAKAIITKLNGGTFPEIKFFNMGYMTIGGRTVRALRHGMAGTPGLEVWGPYEERDEVRQAILDAGADFGILPVGSRAYPTTAMGSGWIPSALPAIYTDAALRPYREWLPATGYEAASAIGGSFVSDDLADYYITPYEMGYGHTIKFDHDFIGSDALSRMDPATQRRKVTYEWEPEDVAKVMASFVTPGQPHYKYIDMPMSIYSSHDYDRVTVGDRLVGFSMFAGYEYNFQRQISLGVVGPEVKTGDEVVITWGEPGGGSRKTTVEPHLQFPMRARVNVVPYSQVAREEYHDGWRKRVQA